MKSISSHIIDFLEYMEIEKGRTIASTKNYDRYLKFFADFAQKNHVEKPEQITFDLVQKYRLSMNRVKKPITHATQNYYLIALRSFLKYLGKMNISTLPPEKIELAKTQERQITFLEADELDQILATPDQKTIQGRRDKAILDLFFSTGLRVSELVNLRRDEINLERNEFSVKGKGGKIRVVFLDPHAQESLKNYLSSRTDKSDWLFISYGHRNSQLKIENLKFKIDRMTPRSVQRMIRKYAKKAGITKKVSPHTLRHSFATDLLMSGADLRSVQSLLGHKSVTTTQIYTHITDKHLGEVHQAFHGLRRNKKRGSPEDSSDLDTPLKT